MWVMTPELTRVLWCTMCFRLFQALLSCWKDGTDYSSKAKLPTDAILMRTERMVRVNHCMWHHVACNKKVSHILPKEYVGSTPDTAASVWV